MTRARLDARLILSGFVERVRFKRIIFMAKKRARKVKIRIEIFEGKTKIKSETRKIYENGKRSRRGRIQQADLDWLPPLIYPQIN